MEAPSDVMRPTPAAAARGARRFHAHPSLPIVEHLPVALDAHAREAAAALARRLLDDDPALAATRPFGPDVAPGLGPWPALFIEDHSWIALFEGRGDVAYSYRALMLAGAGDRIVVVPPRSPAFEAYCRDVLGLGAVEVLTPRRGAAGAALALQAARDARLVARLAAGARRAGGLNVIPYMGTGGVWALAGRIAEAAGVPVRVAAPPPRLTRGVNDKAWFAHCVDALLGRRALPPAYAAYNLAALAGHVARLARSCASVAVKLVDSASSAGNVILDADELRDVRLAPLRARLDALLRGVGWRGTFPLLVTAWEQPVLASPSVQIWVPPRGEGDPVVEGVFDQAVVGRTAVFSGATATSLPPDRQRRLAEEAARVALLFQELGYVGRCSFDSILVGAQARTARLHWVECNGRWGGVSIPMTLANRLLGDWRRSPPVIVERGDLHGRACDLRDVLSRLDDLLYRPGPGGAGAVMLSPGRVAEGTGFEMMVLAPSPEEARARAEALAGRLTRLIAPD